MSSGFSTFFPLVLLIQLSLLLLGCQTDTYSRSSGQGTFSLNEYAYCSLASQTDPRDQKCYNYCVEAGNERPVWCDRVYCDSSSAVYGQWCNSEKVTSFITLSSGDAGIKMVYNTNGYKNLLGIVADGGRKGYDYYYKTYVSGTEKTLENLVHTYSKSQSSNGKIVEVLYRQGYNQGNQQYKLIKETKNYSTQDQPSYTEIIYSLEDLTPNLFMKSVLSGSSIHQEISKNFGKEVADSAVFYTGKNGGTVIALNTKDSFGNEVPLYVQYTSLNAPPTDLNNSSNKGIALEYRKVSVYTDFGLSYLLSSSKQDTPIDGKGISVGIIGGEVDVDSGGAFGNKIGDVIKATAGNNDNSATTKYNSTPFAAIIAASTKNAPPVGAYISGRSPNIQLDGVAKGATLRYYNSMSGALNTNAPVSTATSMKTAMDNLKNALEKSKDSDSVLNLSFSGIRTGSQLAELYTGTGSTTGFNLEQHYNLANRPVIDSADSITSLKGARDALKGYLESRQKILVTGTGVNDFAADIVTSGTSLAYQHNLRYKDGLKRMPHSTITLPADQSIKSGTFDKDRLILDMRYGNQYRLVEHIGTIPIGISGLASAVSGSLHNVLESKYTGQYPSAFLLDLWFSSGLLTYTEQETGYNDTGIFGVVGNKMLSSTYRQSSSYNFLISNAVDTTYSADAATTSYKGFRYSSGQPELAYGSNLCGSQKFACISIPISDHQMTVRRGSKSLQSAALDITVPSDMPWAFGLDNDFAINSAVGIGRNEVHRLSPSEQSSAFLTGAVALMQQAFPGLTANQITFALRHSAVPKYGQNYDFRKEQTSNNFIQPVHLRSIYFTAGFSDEEKRSMNYVTSRYDRDAFYYKISEGVTLSSGKVESSALQLDGIGSTQGGYSDAKQIILDRNTSVNTVANAAVSRHISSVSSYTTRPPIGSQTFIDVHASMIDLKTSYKYNNGSAATQQYRIDTLSSSKMPQGSTSNYLFISTETSSDFATLTTTGLHFGNVEIDPRINLLPDTTYKKNTFEYVDVDNSFKSKFNFQAEQRTYAPIKYIYCDTFGSEACNAASYEAANRDAAKYKDLPVELQRYNEFSKGVVRLRMLNPDIKNSSAYNDLKYEQDHFNHEVVFVPKPDLDDDSKTKISNDPLMMFQKHPDWFTRAPSNVYGYGMLNLEDAAKDLNYMLDRSPRDKSVDLQSGIELLSYQRSSDKVMPSTEMHALYYLPARTDAVGNNDIVLNVIGDAASTYADVRSDYGSMISGLAGAGLASTSAGANQASFRMISLPKMISGMQISMLAGSFMDGVAVQGGRIIPKWQASMSNMSFNNSMDSHGIPVELSMFSPYTMLKGFMVNYRILDTDFRSMSFGNKNTLSLMNVSNHIAANLSRNSVGFIADQQGAFDNPYYRMVGLYTSTAYSFTRSLLGDRMLLSLNMLDSYNPATALMGQQFIDHITRLGQITPLGLFTAGEGMRYRNYLNSGNKLLSIEALMHSADKKSSYSVSIGRLHENGSILGTSGTNLLSIAGASTVFSDLKIMHRLFSSDYYFMGHLSFGNTNVIGSHNSIFKGGENITTGKFSFGMAKENFLDGTLAVVFNMPNRILAGNLSMAGLVDGVMQHGSIGLISDHPETNQEIIYSKTKGNLSVGMNFMLRQNPLGIPDRHDAVALLRMQYSV